MQALWMIVSSLLFALMGVCIKLAATGFSSAEILCFRGIFGMALMWCLARMQRVSLATRVPLMHGWR